MFGNRAQMGGMAGPTGYSGGGQQMQYKAPTTPFGGQPSRLPTMPQRPAMPQLPQQAAPQAQAHARPANWGASGNIATIPWNLMRQQQQTPYLMAGQTGTFIGGGGNSPFSQMAMMALLGRGR